MFHLKNFIVFAIFLILALLIFGGKLNFNQSGSSSESDNPKKFSNTDSLAETSKKFKYYLDLILNNPIDKQKIQLSLKSFQPSFEREYLSALLEKRSGRYEESFKGFFSLLDKLPTYPGFYEELALSAKISDNLNKITDWLKVRKDGSGNPFYLYLEAMVEFQNGQTTVGVEKLELLVNQNFIFKELFVQLANAYRILGNYDKSFICLLEAEKLCLDNDPFLAKIINLKGTIYYLSGEYDKANAEYKSALKKSQSTGNKIEEIKSVANLAIIKDLYGEIYEARDDFHQAIEMAKIIENTELLAFLHSELGVSYTYTNNLIDSRKNYETSLELYELIKNTERLSYLSSNIGSLYLQISNYNSAFEYFKKGLTHAGENKFAKILNLTGLGDVYSNESNYAKALEYYSLAKAIADSVKDVSSILKIEQGIGALYFNVNKPYEALEILMKTESKISSTESPYEQIKLFSKIGTVLTSVDSLAAAENYFEKALSLAENVDDIYSSLLIKTELAHNSYQQNNYDKALKLLNQVQTLSEKYDLTQLFGVQEFYKGKIFCAQGKYNLSDRNLENAFNISGEVHDYNNQIEAAYLLGKNFDERTEYSKAETWYNNAIKIIERISLSLTLNQEIQISHFSGVNSVYNSLAELYLKQGKGKEAFFIIDKARSRNTKSNLNRLKLLAHLKNESEYKQLIDLQWMITSGLYDKSVTDSLDQLLADFTKNLSSRSKELEALLNSDYSLDISELQKGFTDDDYIISVYVSDEFLTLFSLSSANFNFKTLPINRDSLIAMLQSVSPVYQSDLESQEIYINEDLFSFNALASFKLYNSVFKDFLVSIPKNSNLIFNLPTELLKFPVEMLVTEWRTGESPYLYSDKSFLLNDYKISYSPSSTIYIMQNYNSVNVSDQNLLIGDPYIMDSEYSLSVRSGLLNINPTNSRSISLSPLKYSKNEIESIDETINSNLIFKSEEATETNFKNNAHQSNVIHISTHSFLIKDQPLILFANQNDGQDDGFLELGEIVQLNLNSDLVVLSSCRSGLGRLDEAEGIIGMQKAFFDAGSKSVLVSLWDVNDKYTSFFMKDFYTHLANGKSKTEALRQTKLDFIKNYSANPYYWSAFVLSGNSSPINIEQASPVSIVNVLTILLLASIIYFIFSRIRSRKSR